MTVVLMECQQKVFSGQGTESAVVQRKTSEIFRLLMRNKCKICKRCLFQQGKRKPVIPGKSTNFFLYCPESTA